MFSKTGSTESSATQTRRYAQKTSLCHSLKLKTKMCNQYMTSQAEPVTKLQSKKQSTYDNDHDAAFRASMALPEVHQPFFEHYLPAEINQRLDYDSSEQISDTFVDEELKLSACDVVFKARIANSDAYLVMLIEHQSTEQTLMPLRILNYSLKIMKHAAELNKEKAKPLPLVYPIVLYHNKKSYSGSCDIKDLIDAPRDMIDQIWSKSFQLIDLTTYEDSLLEKQGIGGALNFALKHIWDKQQQYLPRLIKLLSLNESGEYIVLSNILLKYVLKKGDINKGAFMKIVNEKIQSEDIKNGIISVAEQLRQEGILEGEVKGRTEGILKGKIEGRIESISEVAQTMLRKGVALKTIAEYTKLSLTDIRKLEQEIVRAH